MNFEHRIARLERENRIVKGFFLSALLAIAGHSAVAGDAAPAKIVEAEGFVLRDKTGVERGSFKVSGTSAKLEIRDGEGNDRIVLYHIDKTAALGYPGGTSVTFFRLGAANAGPSASMSLYGPDPRIKLWGEGGKEIWKMPADAK